MDTMQQELQSSYPALRIQLLGINERGQEPGNPSAIAGRTLPWLQDVDANSDGKSDVFTSWQVALRDVVILDGSNAKVNVYNLNSRDLANAANYATLRGILVDAAMASQLPWRNPNNPLDVDNQNGVTPLDVLIVINRLNAAGAGALPPPVTAQLLPPFYDTSGDNEITALDALQVINYLNSTAAAAAGEGEGSEPTTAVLTKPIEFAPAPSMLGQAQANRLAPQLNGASMQTGVHDEVLADDAWRVGVELAFADAGRSEPLPSPLSSRLPASSRAPSDLELLDEWWAHDALL
jgi:hypothetical protein